jgi:hypothetical protein
MIFIYEKCCLGLKTTKKRGEGRSKTKDVNIFIKLLSHQSV